MNWDLDPELRALGHRYVAPREAEHPYDVKMRADARIMREHQARCTVVGCCVAAEDGKR